MLLDVLRRIISYQGVRMQDGHFKLIQITNKKVPTKCHKVGTMREIYSNWGFSLR